MTSLRRASILTVLASWATLSACGGGGGGGGGGGSTSGGSTTRTLTVVPNQSSVEPTQALQLTASTANVTSPSITFTLVPPTSLRALTADEVASNFGTLDTSGKFTAASAAKAGLRGAVIVKEVTASLQQEVPILIVPAIQTVTVSPDSAAVLAGKTTSFTAKAVDFLGQEVTSPLVDWRVTGGVGTITSAGVFTGVTAGTGTIEARVGLASAGTAQITVVGSTVGLSIAPLGNPVEVETGTTRQFKAQVSDNSGNSLVVTATWSVTPATLGTIDAAGNFVAGAVGQTGTVKAVYQDRTATMPVKVVALIQPPSSLPGNVFGTISDATNKPIAGATVVAKRTSDDATVDTTTSDSNGGYALFLPAGTYTIAASAGSLRGQQTPVELASQDVRRQVNLVLVASSRRR